MLLSLTTNSADWNVMDIASISSALTGLTATFDLAKTAIAARDEAKLSCLQEAMQKRIIEIQNLSIQLLEKNSTAQDEVHAIKSERRELKSKIADLERQISERRHYRLHQLSDGVFIYAYDPTAYDATPAHYLCQPCMDNESKKGVLALTPNRCYWICPVCNHKYATGVARPALRIP